MQELLQEVIQEGISLKLPQIEERAVKLPTDTGKIISVTGPRRAGKTYALFSAIKDLRAKLKHRKHHIIYLNLEDERLLPLSTHTLTQLLKTYQTMFPDVELSKTYWFFDEIQNAPAWEKFINRLYRQTQNVFITGSNSKLLSTEIASGLRGRTLTYTVYPLSFIEFLHFKGVLRSLGDASTLPQTLTTTPSLSYKLSAFFKEYLQYGSYPEVVLQKNANIKLKLLQEYFSGIFYRDLIERYHIEKPHLLRFFIKRLFESIGKPFSVHKVYNQVKSAGYKVSKDTLYDYLDMIQAVFLAFPVKKFAKSELKLQFMPQKLYAMDWGLVQAVTPPQRSAAGAMLENVTGANLHYTNAALFYDSNGYECDFLVINTSAAPTNSLNSLFAPTKIDYAIQVVSDTSEEDTIQREIQGLAKSIKRYNIKKAYLITSDPNVEYLRSKLPEELKPQVKVQTVWEFLVDNLLTFFA